MTALDALLDRARWPELAAALAPWMAVQRWFGGKARTVAGVAVSDVALPSEAVALVIADVAYDDGSAERYQVPLAVGEPPVATVGDLALRDATDDPDACRVLARVSLRETEIPTAAGAVVRGVPVGEPRRAELARVRKLGVEQSNTSVVLDESLIMKVFRKLEAGVNPDVELTRALTEAGFRHVPPQAGALRVDGLHGDAEPTYLGVVSAFLGGAREGWDLAVREAKAVLDGSADPALAASMGELGAVVARMHLVLRDSLGAEGSSADDADAWAAAMVEQAKRVLALAAARDPEATAPITAAAEELLARFGGLAEIEDLGVKIRTHGDLHLGQVLLDDGGWQLLDFEGEPARPLAERRHRHTPLRDVAGVLRSFDYAAASAALHPPPRLAAWRDGLRAAFLDGYRAVAVPERLVPEGAWAPLLAALELDKATYELGYELANRPDWVAIPVAGILRVLEATRASDTSQRRRPRSTPVPTTQPTDPPPRRADQREVAALVSGSHRDPHRLLGPHKSDDGAVVRVFRPDASSVEVVAGGTAVEAERTHDAGFFEAHLDEMPIPNEYRLRVSYADETFELWDAYAFWPTFGEVDLHLHGEGRHEELWRRMGATCTEIEGVAGVAFAVWAPNARSVRVVGGFNSWDGRLHQMRMLGASGIWELFVPDVGSGTLYKYEIVTADGRVVTRADPFAKWAEVPPGQASRVFASSYEWGDAEWFAHRAERDPARSPMSIYEVHLGSWKHADGSSLSYRDLAHELAEHCTELGFTHVELLPVAEHPFGGSWGYQVSGYYAPTARFGDPDDFRYLVDHLHQHDIGVIVDWVPAHFPKDEWALARFDGTALYEHLDPRKGEHPDWGTLVFNFGRNEVRNFLIANALFWLEELHVDGLRVDAVASMLYLDYSRSEGEWIPNEYGGRENLEAVSFLQELNRVVYGRNPHAITIAEESTAWPGVTRPVHLGGLGFGFKWNMGWMHDTLSYASRDPVYRRYHHHEMTFGLMYAWSENFILPLSHDEVVHGKRSLLDKMPGDRWRKFANLRALYAWMWAHPGKQLVFMGGEFGQWREWSEQRSLDWHLLDEPDHRGLQRLMRDLNAAYRDAPALWRADVEPAGFQWIDANNADANFFAFLRRGDTDDPPLVCLANLSPLPREGMRVGLPQAGAWREVLNTDAEVYGGGNVGNYGVVHAADEAWHGQPASADVVVPPLGTVWLVPDEQDDRLEPSQR